MAPPPYATQRVRLSAQSQKSAEQCDDDTEEVEESDIEEELGFFSLVDAINPYTTFKHALTSAWIFFGIVSPRCLLVLLPRLAFQNKIPALYQAATTALSVEQQTVLMEVMSLAETQQQPAQ